MSHAPTPDSLGRRLVTQRLSAPGMLDHGTLRRARERLRHPAGAHVLDRLHRRVVPGSPGTENLPLVRLDRSAEPDATVASGGGAPAPITERLTMGQPITERLTTGQPITERLTTGQMGASGDANAIRSPLSAAASGATIDRAVARQIPTITRGSELVIRRVADGPGLTGMARVSASAPHQGETWPTEAPDVPPSVTTGPALAATVQRTAAATAVAVRVIPATASADASPMLMRSPSPTTATHDAPRAPTRTGPPPQATSRAMRAPMPLLMRQRTLTENRRATVVPVVAARSIVAEAALPQLVLRKPDASARLGLPQEIASSISTAPTGVIARKGAAPVATPSDATGRVIDSRSIEWITEQVGNRLARRLEIARERIGVRQWR